MNRLIALFQVKYKMIQFSHYYLIYDNDVDTTSIVTMQLVVVLYQVKCEMISPFHLIYNNNDDDNTNFSTSINGEKYTNQSKYKDNYIKCQAPATISTTTTTAAQYKYLYRMKFTPTTEDSSSTNNKTEDRIDLNMTIISCNNNSSNYRYNNGIVIMIRILNITCLHTLISTTQIGENKDIDGMEKIGEYQSRALRSEGQYKDEVYNAEEGMFQEPITINNSTYSNIANIGIVDYCNDTRKENGERTTCYSSQDPYMIQYCTNTIAINATLRLGHYNEGKIDINTRINNINNNYWYNNNDETTTLISIGDETTRTSIGDKATTLIRTIQNEEKHNRLNYNMVIVLIYDHVISMIPVQLCSCILLIVTMRLLSQSMGSVKIHKDRVLKLI